MDASDEEDWAGHLPSSRAYRRILVGLGAAGVAVAVLPWSWVADRLGRLRAMQVAIIASTVLGVLVALAPSL
ncbi:MAG: ynfM, partial [Humibacillus sp.]|nr:ynfM [Humibacillus sp.]